MLSLTAISFPSRLDLAWPWWSQQRVPESVQLRSLTTRRSVICLSDRVEQMVTIARRYESIKRLMELLILEASLGLTQQRHM